MTDILRAVIGIHTLAMIDLVHTAMSELHIDITTSISELLIEIHANNATQVMLNTRLTQVERQLAAVKDVCRDLTSQCMVFW